MARAGLMTKEVTRGVAALQMRICMPCLLFARILPAVSPRLLRTAWPMMVLPALYVPIGLMLGIIVARLNRPAANQYWTVVCAVAYPNSISLPTVILSVIQEEMYRGRDAVPPDGLVSDPMVYVGFYQPPHMALLWGLGAWLMGVSIQRKPSTPSTRPAIETPASSQASSSAL